jgi:hypothetical protein
MDTVRLRSTVRLTVIGTALLRSRSVFFYCWVDGLRYNISVRIRRRKVSHCICIIESIARQPSSKIGDEMPIDGQILHRKINLFSFSKKFLLQSTLQ